MDRSSLHSRAVRPSEHLDVSGPHTTASQVWSECEALEKVNGHGTSTRVALGLMAYATSQKRLRLIKGPSECMVSRSIRRAINSHDVGSHFRATLVRLGSGSEPRGVFNSISGRYRTERWRRSSAVDTSE